MWQSCRINNHINASIPLRIVQRDFSFSIFVLADEDSRRRECGLTQTFSSRFLLRTVGHPLDSFAPPHQVIVERLWAIPYAQSDLPAAGVVVVDQADGLRLPILVERKSSVSAVFVTAFDRAKNQTAAFVAESV